MRAGDVYFCYLRGVGQLRMELLSVTIRGMTVSVGVSILWVGKQAAALERGGCGQGRCGAAGVHFYSEESGQAALLQLES